MPSSSESSAPPARKLNLKEFLLLLELVLRKLSRRLERLDLRSVLDVSPFEVRRSSSGDERQKLLRLDFLSLV